MDRRRYAKFGGWGCQSDSYIVDIIFEISAKGGPLCELTVKAVQAVASNPALQDKDGLFDTCINCYLYELNSYTPVPIAIADG